MENLFNIYENYMAYINKLDSTISSKMDELRDSTINSNRILILSRYVRQLKNKNSAFSFTRNPYEFIINPGNYTYTSNLFQFVQNSSFLISHLQENPSKLAFIIHSTKKQWQFLYLIDCIIPSIFGYFACHEYIEMALSFYSEIINEFPPNSYIQIIQPFLHSSLTYHFFENSFGRFIYLILVDKHILKNPDELVLVFTDLLIENIRDSIKFLPKEFFELLDVIQKKRWHFDDISSLILDNFLIPELKIWSSQLDNNIELKNFVYRIIDLITISMSQQFNENNELNLSPRSSSMNFQSSLYLTDFSGSTNLTSLCFNLEFDQVQPKISASRSYSILNPSQNSRTSENTRRINFSLNSLINSFFIEPDQVESVYETIKLYEKYPNEIFTQYTHYTLSFYDIQFLARILIKKDKCPSNISSFVFFDDEIKPFIGGVFYCHIFSQINEVPHFQPFFSIFTNNEVIQTTNHQTNDVDINILFLANESFVKFLKFNRHYGELFDSLILKSKEKIQSDQIRDFDKRIVCLTFMDEIRKQNDKFLYHSSFLLESFTNDILNDAKKQSNNLKNISFIQIFKRISKRFDYSNLFQMKKILYFKLVDLYCVDLIGSYWNVLVDFKNYWLEFVANHEKKKNVVTKYGFFTHSIELLSKIDNKPLHVKYLFVIWAFSMINHIANHAQNKEELYEMVFKRIKSKEFILSFLIIDNLGMRFDIFKKLCTKEEINCWNNMKKSIETYLKQNCHYYQVYLSISEYLFAISPSVLFNTVE